jgi:hypothetical protein
MGSRIHGVAIAAALLAGAATSEGHDDEEAMKASLHRADGLRDLSPRHGRPVRCNEGRSLARRYLRHLACRDEALRLGEGETVVQFHGDGPWIINYLNPVDDPRTRK